MKNFLKFKSFLGLVVASLILVSCAQSDKVVNNNLIQKRKYNKGFFIDLKKNKNEAVAVTNTKVEKKAVEVKETEVKNETAPVLVASNKEVIAETSTAVQSATTAKKEVVIEENIVLSKKVERVMKKVNKAIVKQNSKNEATVSPAAGAAGGKSQWIALILCWAVGIMGIHRFYLGYTWQGVVQLLTGGACGIWTLIDLIRIFTGDLGPASGRYSKTI